MNKAEITEIFRRFSIKKPHPKIELDYTNPFELLVAVVLSAQATDRGVNRVTPALFAVANNPAGMVALGEDKLKEYIKSIGLFNTKAKNIIAMSKVLVEKFDSKIPGTLEALESLPGVGRKSANVMLNCIFGYHTIAVDTHVFRVSNRIGFCKTKNPLQTEQALIKKVPAEYKERAHHWLVLHGRYICKARKPECGKCIIDDICRFKDKKY